MARFIPSSRKLIGLCLARTSSVAAQQYTRNHFSSSAAVQKSALESNIIRILRTEINYQSQTAPPPLPAEEFNAFTVEDRPGEQWITMKSKYGDKETIKIEATMFDGSALAPKSGDASDVENISLHISLLVDVSRGEERDLEFVCSAWPDHIEIQKVYILDREKSFSQPYMGPNFRHLDTKLQNSLTEFLKERGVNDDLSVFLHDFMLEKDRIELINWLRNVKSFVKK